jgi:hypothetical protein
MKDFIRIKLREGVIVPKLRLPKNIQISEDELIKLKNITYDQIRLEEDGQSGSVIFMRVDFPFETSASEGIIFDIQVLFDKIYQPHLAMVPSLQNLGLGTKIMMNFIEDFGHLYFGKGRTLNDNINKLIDKLIKSGSFEVYSDKKGVLILKQGNTDKENIIKIIDN